MEIRMKDGIEYTKEADYLSAPMDTKIDHVLVDIQNEKIITHEKINCAEKERRNKKAQKVGEIFLQWAPALYAE